jgi:DNA-binding CsgD family transcriptional regulator
MAAVIGRQFDQAVLGDLLTELSAGALSVALEEALSLRVIEELPQLGNYQFSHPLLHDTVYKDIPPPRRLALHRAVAEWLERRGGHDPDRLLPRLAFHFTRCAAAGAADKAIRYLKRAAARADALHAHWEAIGYYRDALRLDRQLGGNETAELIAALGQAQMRGGANELAEQTFLEAIELARRTNDASLFRRAVLGFENTSWREGRAGGPAVALLEEALACAAPSDQRSMIELNSALCRANIYADRPQQAIIAHRRAVGAARDLGEPHLLFRALAAIAPAMLFPELLEARLDAAREAMALAEGCGHLEWAVDHLTGWYFYDLVEIGNVEAARRIADLHLRVANSLRDPFLQAVGQVAKTILAMQQNVGPMVESEIEKARTLGQRWAVDRADGAYGLQMFTLRREQGQLGDLRPVLKHYLDHRPAATWQAALILVYLELGMIAEAEAEFRAIAAGGFSKVPRNALWPASLAYLAEACTYLNAATYAATLYENLVPYSGRNIMSGTVCLGSADRYLGMVATLLRDRKLCDQHFAKALALDARCNHPIWLAHTRYEYASALIARNEASDQPRAADFLKQALLTSEQLGLVALKRRCLSLRERLSARRDAPDGLSQREIKVLRLLAAGASNQAIATKLCISPHTVANHVRSILAKINCENRTQAAAYALRHGLADAE